MFRMMPNQFEKLLALITPRISKAITRVGVIPTAERLCVALQYLTTGDGYAIIAASYRIRRTTVIIWDALLEEGYLKAPQNVDDWKEIAINTSTSK